jgi:hypothetical protein
MKYTVEIGSVATIYIQDIIKTGLGIQKLITGCKETHRQYSDHISLLQE